MWAEEEGRSSVSGLRSGRNHGRRVKNTSFVQKHKAGDPEREGRACTFLGSHAARRQGGTY